MIGVIADRADEDVVREFFELFKTPWEFFNEGRRYNVLLCAGDPPPDVSARVVVLYAGRTTGWDSARRIGAGRTLSHSVDLVHGGERIPIYGKVLTFARGESSLLTVVGSGECAAFSELTANGWVVRLGYDLFAEVRFLLTEGQPSANAQCPTLDLHIAFLRDLIIRCGVALTEIPPVPEGYNFIVCLTHDVDHPSIRMHRWDHTMFGFLYRAAFDSVRNLLRGRSSFRSFAANWAAVVKLPFVHMGWARDFWRDFDLQYLELERELPSSYFIIPFPNRPGKIAQGTAPAIRASGYGVRDIEDVILRLMATGREVGLHGIDAWIDSRDGREEFAELRHLTGAEKIGVRMHWLYFSPDSPRLLEQAGASYDSTVGYNGAVGYRAGTTQPYKPLDCNQLLELPLHVMDTALFYPTRMSLSNQQAWPILERMIENSSRFGGCLTINWHDRSLAPERQWGAVYCDLIRELRAQGAWFATLGQAASWCDRRRSALFVRDSEESSTVRAWPPADGRENLPSLQLRKYRALESVPLGAPGSIDFTDQPLGENASVPCIPAS